MTRDEEFPERFRAHAAGLKYSPDDPAVFTRLSARVAAEIRTPRHPLELLAAWFRPIAATLLMLLSVSTAALMLSDTYTLEQISSFAEKTIVSEDYGLGLD